MDTTGGNAETVSNSEEIAIPGNPSPQRLSQVENVALRS